MSALDNASANVAEATSQGMGYDAPHYRQRQPSAQAVTGRIERDQDRQKKKRARPTSKSSPPGTAKKRPAFELRTTGPETRLLARRRRILERGKYLAESSGATTPEAAALPSRAGTPGDTGSARQRPGNRSPDSVWSLPDRSVGSRSPDAELMRTYINPMLSVLRRHGLAPDALVSPDIRRSDIGDHADDPAFIMAIGHLQSFFQNSFPPGANTIIMQLVNPGAGYTRTRRIRDDDGQDFRLEMQILRPTSGTDEERAAVMLSRMLHQFRNSALPLASDAYLRARGIASLYINLDTTDIDMLSETYAHTARGLRGQLGNEQLQGAFWRAVQGDVLLQLDRIAAERRDRFDQAISDMLDGPRVANAGAIAQQRLEMNEEMALQRRVPYAHFGITRDVANDAGITAEARLDADARDKAAAENNETQKWVNAALAAAEGNPTLQAQIRSEDRSGNRVKLYARYLAATVFKSNRDAAEQIVAAGDFGDWDTLNEVRMVLGDDMVEHDDQVDASVDLEERVNAAEQRFKDMIYYPAMDAAGTDDWRYQLIQDLFDDGNNYAILEEFLALTRPDAETEAAARAATKEVEEVTVAYMKSLKDEGGLGNDDSDAKSHSVNAKPIPLKSKGPVQQAGASSSHAEASSSSAGGSAPGLAAALQAAGSNQRAWSLILDTHAAGNTAMVSALTAALEAARNNEAIVSTILNAAKVGHTAMITSLTEAVTMAGDDEQALSMIVSAIQAQNTGGQSSSTAAAGAQSGGDVDGQERRVGDASIVYENMVRDTLAVVAEDPELTAELQTLHRIGDRDTLVNWYVSFLEPDADAENKARTAAAILNEAARQG
jgi:hypothetical protein